MASSSPVKGSNSSAGGSVAAAVAGGGSEGMIPGRWDHIRSIISRPSAFANETGKLPIGEYT
jgi:hypothetical protein